MTLNIEEKHLHIVHKILHPYDYSFFVFGSRITEKAKKLSDLDLLYFDNIPNPCISRLEEAFEASDLPYKVDLVNYHQCEESFKNCIAKNYICLQSSSKLASIEQTALSHFTFLPQHLGCDGVHHNGITMMHSGLHSGMLNIAYGAPQDLKPLDAIQEIHQAFGGQSLAWWIPPSHHRPELTNALLKHGFIIKMVGHAMMCNIADVNMLTQTTDLRIEHVTEKTLLQDFIRVLEPYDASVCGFYKMLNPKQLPLQQKLFVGYISDEPVTMGILFISDNSSGIFSLMTSDTSSKKSYTIAMICFLIKTAKEKGSTWVTLFTPNASATHIYEKLGFQKIGEFECFERPPNAAS